MELSTRCPHCETVFAVALEQLQLRKGYIRCIQCAHIFDGFEAVIPTETVRPAGVPPASRPVAPPAARPAPPDARQPGPDTEAPRFTESRLPASRLPEPEPSQPRFSESRLPESRLPAAPAREPTLREPGIPPSAPGPASGGQPSGEPAVDRFIIPPPKDTAPEDRASTRPFSIGPAKTAPDGEPAFRTPSLGTAAIGGALEREPQIPHVVSPRAVAAPPGVAHGVSGYDGLDPESAYDHDADDPQLDEALYMEPRAGHRSRGRPELFDGPRHSRGWMTLLWMALTVCGLATLLAQGAYVYRAQLANAFPALRPTLEAACERIGCVVPYERRIDAIAITGSALRSSAAPQDDVSSLTLEVTLRNTHERPQEWPTLVLDLKDASGAVVVRRNLSPDTWVPVEKRGGPFAAGHEITVQLPVSVRGLQANGYQLDKFFP